MSCAATSWCAPPAMQCSIDMLTSGCLFNSAFNSHRLCAMLLLQGMPDDGHSESPACMHQI
jgi:hypothetical protein